MTRPIRKEKHHRRGDRVLIALSTAALVGTALPLAAFSVNAKTPVPQVPVVAVSSAATPATAPTTPAVNPDDPAQPDAGAVPASPIATTGWTIMFGGDTMAADGAQPLIAAEGYGAPFRDVTALTQRAGTVVVNVEAPITTSTFNARPGAKFTYAMPPQAAAAMKAAGIDVVATANNHVMDRGPQGMVDTAAAARANGMTAIGTGANQEEALKPVILNTPEGKVAIVNMGENFGPLVRAEENKPGMIDFNPGDIQKAHDTARAAGATTVIAFVHWGDNYADVNEQQRYWADMLTKAGFDAVIGAGSHTAQPYAAINGRPVVFGLGNFVFGSPGRYADFGKQGIGLTATTTIVGGSLTEIRLNCLKVDNEDATVNYRARLCTPAEQAPAFAALAPGQPVVGDQAIISVKR